MATTSVIAEQLKKMLAALPQQSAKLSSDQIKAMLDVWQEDLADIPDDLLTTACRSHREQSQWLPSIFEIRKAAVGLMRQASPANQDASDAWEDVRRAIQRVGSYGLPEFDNPITTEIVKRMGWREICLSESPTEVIRAQFERYYNEHAGRLERNAAQSPAVRQFIGAMQIGNGNDPIRRIAAGDEP